jgi:enamine deaminase RidA (YjgF/YER057c/UK114 family)
MSIQRIEIGRRMSQAVIYNGVVYLAGQVADDGVGSAVHAQTASILSRIDTLLAAAGTDKSKLLSATVWLSDMDQYPEMNRAWDNWVSPGNTPARACVEVRLAAPQYAVEISIIAAV